MLGLAAYYGVVLALLVVGCTARTYKWRNLTEQELHSWYTPTDLCVLNSTNKFAFPQDIRKDECYEFSRGNRRIHCSVGMGNNNNPCFGPFAEGRPHFRMGVEGYTDVTSTPLLKAFQKFADTNTTLFFLGDSTTRQKLQALDCEIHREDPRIRTLGNIWGILPCNTKYTIILPDKRSIYMRIISIGPNSATCLKGGQGRNGPANGAFENAAYMIDRENNVYNRSVFVVANMGLWYNDESEYEKVMPPVLEWLQQVATFSYQSMINFAKVNMTTIEDLADTTSILLQNTGSPGDSPTAPSRKHDVTAHAKRHGLHNTVAWHESFAQHWINPWGTGYFAKPSLEEQTAGWKEHAGNYSKIPTAEYVTPFGCRRVTNTSYMADWRNDIVSDILKDSDKNMKDIVVFPMADITRYADCVPVLVAVWCALFLISLL
jgi:hypothetical protein